MELSDQLLKVDGSIPSWLNGTLIRNGPAKFDLGKTEVKHWFDGMSLLQSFRFTNGQVVYSCQFLKSNAYTKSAQNGELCSHEFATNPHESWLARIKSVLTQPETDNGNVNITKINDRYLALTETPFPIEFNPNTLATIGPFVFEDKLQGQITTAHPQYDIDSRHGYNLLTGVSKTSHYQLYVLKPNSNERTLLSTIPVKEPGYIHSFALTEKHLVLLEFPLLLEPLSLALSGKPYIENYHWHKDRPTRIIVINRNDGSITASLDTDPCFAFHHVNAYETPDSILVDLAAYDDASIIETFYLSNIRQEQAMIPGAKLRRYEISLHKKSVRHEVLADVNLELPSINFAANNGKPYRYLYAAAPAKNGDFLSSLIKVDLQRGKQLSWSEDQVFTGEPTFVPAVDTKAEDHGIIISLCLDAKQQKSMLVVLDATSMQEIARAFLPTLTPFALHGQFFSQRS